MSFRRRRLLRAGHNHVDRARAGPSRRHHPLLGQRISGLVLPADRRPAARSDAGPSRVGPPGRRAAGPFPLVVPDLRAHSQSTGSFDFAAAVDDVGALLEALPTDELILVGLSLGANIAQDLVQQDPGRVRALVLADATSNTAARHPTSSTFSVAALQWQALVSGAAFARQAAPAMAYDPRGHEYVMEANGRRSSSETVAILSSLLNGLQVDPTYRLPVPTLLVHGQFDLLGDINTAARRGPNARSWPSTPSSRTPGTRATSTTPRRSRRSSRNFCTE